MSERRTGARSTDRCAEVDDEGLTLPADVVVTVDVRFDGERVWSFSPQDDKAVTDGRRRITWPRLLRPHLDGTTYLEVVEHASGAALYAAQHAFGAGEGRLRFTDAQGKPRVIDKWGFVQKPLSSRDPASLAPVLDATEEILDVLATDCGVPAWLAFGSLLGAVRAGKVIPHDNDLDVAYLSAFETPVDVARELFRISRALQRRGMRVLTKTGSFVTVIIAIPGGQLAIDVYACFYVGDVLYESSSVGAPVPREALLPLGTVEFEGRRFPAPHDPRALLAASYGPGWEVPDPGFRYQIPPSLKRRFLGWFGSSMRSRRHWDRLYEGALGHDVSDEPSEFAQWVLPQVAHREGPFLDVGCGNGRDTLWLARQGLSVTGLDYSKATMSRCRTKATALEVPATFRLLNLYDLRDTLVQGSLLARELPGPRTVYARFLLHALEPDGRRNFWQLADMMLRGGGEAYIEFRTGQDRGRVKAFERHFCHYLRPDDVCAEAERAGGEVVERAEGTGLSPYDGEDPHLCRLKVVWTR